jgi:hypothetical protein
MDFHRQKCEGLIASDGVGHSYVLPPEDSGIQDSTFFLVINLMIISNRRFEFYQFPDVLCKFSELQLKLLHLTVSLGLRILNLFQHLHRSSLYRRGLSSSFCIGVGASVV